MSISQRYNRTVTGIASGIILPLIALMIFYLATSDGLSVAQYIRRTLQIGNLIQIMSVCVFANIAIFLAFNHFDMEKAMKGVLGITIVWALAVFGYKLF